MLESNTSSLFTAILGTCTLLKSFHFMPLYTLLHYMLEENVTFYSYIQAFVTCIGTSCFSGYNFDPKDIMII